MSILPILNATSLFFTNTDVTEKSADLEEYLSIVFKAIKRRGNFCSTGFLNFAHSPADRTTEITIFSHNCCM